MSLMLVMAVGMEPKQSKTELGVTALNGWKRSIDDNKRAHGGGERYRADDGSLDEGAVGTMGYPSNMEGRDAGETAGTMGGGWVCGWACALGRPGNGRPGSFGWHGWALAVGSGPRQQDRAASRASANAHAAGPLLTAAPHQRSRRSTRRPNTRRQQTRDVSNAVR